MVGFLRLAASGLGWMGVLWVAAVWASCTSGSDLPLFAWACLRYSAISSSVRPCSRLIFFVELCLFFGVKGFEVVVNGWVGVVGAVVVDVLFWFYVYAAVFCLCSESCPLVAPVSWLP